MLLALLRCAFFDAVYACVYGLICALAAARCIFYALAVCVYGLNGALAASRLFCMALWWVRWLARWCLVLVRCLLSLVFLSLGSFLVVSIINVYTGYQYRHHQHHLFAVIMITAIAMGTVPLSSLA